MFGKCFGLIPSGYHLLTLGKVNTKCSFISLFVSRYFYSLIQDLIDTTDLRENVLGFVIDGKTSAIDNIATLVKIFNFDAHNNGE